MSIVACIGLLTVEFDMEAASTSGDAGVYAIVGGSRGRDDKKTRIKAAIVHDLVDGLGRDVQGVADRQLACFAFDLDRELSVEDVEHLVRGIVEMCVFGRALWHAFFDHAEAAAVEQAPTVAFVAPGVMLGAVFVCRGH